MATGLSLSLALGYGMSCRSISRRLTDFYEFKRDLKTHIFSKVFVNFNSFINLFLLIYIYLTFNFMCFY